MWGLLEHMLEVLTVARDVHCSQAVEVKLFTGMARPQEGLQEATCLANPRDGASRVQLQQVCVRTQPIVLFSAWV